MRWRASAADSGPIGLHELLEGPPDVEPRARGTLMRYATALEGRSVLEVAALGESQLAELGLKPFHAWRLRRWIAELDETPVPEQEMQHPEDRAPTLRAETIAAMDVGELKRAL